MFDSIESPASVSVLVCYIVIIIIGVVPHFQQPNVEYATVAKEITVKPIIENLSEILDSVEELEEQLMEQSGNIEMLSESLIDEINDRNLELERISSELAYYRTLETLSEEQVDSLLVEFRKDRYIDYIVGFIIGIVTSGLFYLMHRRKLKDKSLKTSG